MKNNKLKNIFFAILIVITLSDLFFVLDHPDCFSIFCFLILVMIDCMLYFSVLRTPRSSTDEKPILVFCKHVSGLSLPENMDVTIRSYPGKITITSSAADFTIDRSKIVDICEKTDVDIQNQYVSSIGGAAAGAVLFGPLGAIVGGRAKQKKSSTYSYYLIISYMKEEELSYLAFEVSHGSLPVSDLIKDFNDTNTNSKIHYDL